MEIRKEEYEDMSKYLENGEQVLWTGKPKKGNVLREGEWFAITMSALWCAMAVYMLISCAADAELLDCIIGVPIACLFMSFGLYMLFGRFIFCSHVKKITAYMITDRKIIVKRGKKIGLHCKKDLPYINVHYFKNGNASIYFGNIQIFENVPAYKNSWKNAAGLNFYEYGIGALVLVNISDVTGARKALAQCE